MKKAVYILITSILLGGAFVYYKFYSIQKALPTFINNHTNKKYIIKRGKNIIDTVDTQEEAIKRAKQIERAVAVNTVNNEWVYSALKPFIIETENAVHDFKTFEEAIRYARRNEYSEIYYNNDMQPIWKAKFSLKNMKNLDVPLILQNPELPRGCEVTSLAMLLKYRGIDTNKIQLAKEVKKDTTAYSKDSNGRIHYGNPYDGFVGDMYNIKNNGYGVYHGPIVELAKKYAGEKVIDLTDMDFEEVLFILSKGNPIWVITNGTYAPLEDEQFVFWYTPTGIVKITTKQHSVVLTGFDEKYVYINDPLSSYKNIRLDKDKFRRAWEQMGNQAVSILK